MDDARTSKRQTPPLPSPSAPADDVESSTAAPGSQPLAKGSSNPKGKGKGKGRAKGRTSKKHEPTQLYLRALVQALLALMPFSNMEPWAPSTFVSLSEHGKVREFDQTSQAYYMWDKESGEAKWCLAPELRGSGRPGVRVLVMCADEGSQGWSLFQYLASSAGGLRFFFFCERPEPSPLECI